jgi:hypothetical protein
LLVETKESEGEILSDSAHRGNVFITYLVARSISPYI